MNKNLFVGIGLLVLVALGIGGYTVLNNRTQSGSPNQENTTTEADQKSLKDLLTLGKTQTCNFSDDMGNTGAIYVSGGKMRGDFSSKIEDKVLGSHMIVDAETSYVWTDGQKEGFKMSFDKQEVEASAQQANEGSVDVDKKIDFSCKAWVSDSSVFVVPTDITFIDFDNLTLPSASGVDKADQCAICDSLSDTTKAQCKTSLKCN